MNAVEICGLEEWFNQTLNSSLQVDSTFFVATEGFFAFMK